jgi:hypothetical protein
MFEEQSLKKLEERKINNLIVISLSKNSERNIILMKNRQSWKNRRSKSLRNTVHRGYSGSFFQKSCCTKAANRDRKLEMVSFDSFKS